MAAVQFPPRAVDRDVDGGHPARSERHQLLPVLRHGTIADQPHIACKQVFVGSQNLLQIGGSALFFALTIQAFAVKPYRIPSESMLPTLKPGQRILVNRLSHRVGEDPKLGDVTVFTQRSVSK